MTSIFFPNEDQPVSVTPRDLQRLTSSTTNWNDDDDDDNNGYNLVQRLFARHLDNDDDPSSSSSSRPEIVEMVDSRGRVLGMVPRPLVHQHNLLHRGIGVLVTKDRPIMRPKVVQHLQQRHLPPDKNGNNNNNSEQQPDLYCHRRTDDKRIFPSLYDMFVGGVSLAGEDAATTARREVAEELGLDLDNHDDNRKQH